MQLFISGPEPDVRFTRKVIEQSHLGEGEGELIVAMYTLHDPLWTF